MLRFPLGPSHRRCDGVTRRDFLRVGGLSAFGLPALLRAEARGAEAATAATAKSVILVYLGGGLSHHDSFDPKPDAPAEVRGKYGVVGTKLPGVTFGDKLPRLAAGNDRFAVVRSGAHGNDHHETATNWVLSGRFGSAFGDYPAIGAVVAHEMGYRGPMPPYFAVPKNPAFTWELGKSAFLGGRYESFKAGDPNDANFRVQDVSPPGDLVVKADRRQSLRAAVDGLARQVEADDQLRTMDEFYARALDLVTSPEARRAFDVRREDPRLRDKYGRTTTGQSCLLARRLVEAGVRFVTVSSGGWDHHANIFPSLDKRLPELDLALSALLDDLDARGLLASTLVVCMGEFGRSPKVNSMAGRDHWGHAASLLFAGGGVQPGRVIGRTDDQGGYVTERPVSPGDVAATIYQAVGVDPTNLLMTPENRPVAILDEGTPIAELF